MKPEIEKTKEYTNKITLTDTEKFDMLQSLRTHMNINPVKSVYSSYMRHAVVYASMLVLIVGTTATSIAAEESLPGDLLYSFKTNVNEEIVKTFAFSDIKKAKINVNLVDRRMGELEKMIVAQKDTPEKITVIINKLEKHKEDIRQLTLEEVASKKAIDAETSKIYATLESVVDTHLNILEGIADNENSKNTLVTNPVSKSSSSTPNNKEQQDKKTSSVIIAHDEESKNTVKINSVATTSEFAETSGERHAVNDISEFDTKLETLLKSIEENRDPKDEDDSEEIKKETRRKIIEEAEEKLRINIEDETTNNIKNSII